MCPAHAVLCSVSVSDLSLYFTILDLFNLRPSISHKLAEAMLHFQDHLAGQSARKSINSFILTRQSDAECVSKLRRHLQQLAEICSSNKLEYPEEDAPLGRYSMTSSVLLRCRQAPRNMTMLGSCRARSVAISRTKRACSLELLLWMTLMATVLTPKVPLNTCT